MENKNSKKSNIVLIIVIAIVLVIVIASFIFSMNKINNSKTYLPAPGNVNTEETEVKQDEEKPSKKIDEYSEYKNMDVPQTTVSDVTTTSPLTFSDLDLAQMEEGRTIIVGQITNNSKTQVNRDTVFDLVLYAGEKEVAKIGGVLEKDLAPGESTRFRTQILLNVQNVNKIEIEVHE